ncbi:MAG TPA: NAD(+) synthase, partial [Phycisphaerales bacterium]|nr:NAD(+) synthase [Phycisphaerales bacterium]
MRLITIAGATLNQTPLDWAGNRANIAAALQHARERRVGVLCLPEMCISGYGCEDAFSGIDVHRRCWEGLRELLPHTRGMAVSFGLPLLYRNAVFNTVALAVDGRLVGAVAKRHLAGEGLHYEPRWFKPWPEGVRAEVETPCGTIPVGDLMFDVGGVRIGFEICEDAWVAKRPGSRLAAHGVDIILNPSASHFAFGKIGIRERFVLEGSRAFGAAYVYANLLGNEAGRAIYDGGVLISSGGRMDARGPRFSMTDWSVTAAVVDLDRQRTEQARTASFQPDVRPDPLCIRVDADLPAADRFERAEPVLPEWETGPRVKEEEFTRAVSIGLWDYLRKSRSRGFIVSLSGGADSAAVIVLIRTMVELAVAELGPQRVRERLAYMGLSGDSAVQMVGRLLITAYQAAEGSSTSSRDAARSIAGTIGSTHHELDVGAVASAYIEMVEKATRRDLTWKTDDLALQNIQARVRAPSVWLLANITGSLLLSTSNRSEAAVGYATMDGDTCGGLCPIGGIDKAFLLTWLRWVEKQGPAGLGPIPGLSVITSRTPTPELRPCEMGQTSEGDLMPYAMLETIEEEAIGDKKSPAEVLLTLQGLHPQIARETLVAWVE